MFPKRRREVRSAETPAPNCKEMAHIRLTRSAPMALFPPPRRQRHATRKPYPILYNCLPELNTRSTGTHPKATIHQHTGSRTHPRNNEQAVHTRSTGTHPKATIHQHTGSRTHPRNNESVVHTGSTIPNTRHYFFQPSTTSAAQPLTQTAERNPAGEFSLVLSLAIQRKNDPEPGSFLWLLSLAIQRK